LGFSSITIATSAILPNAHDPSANHTMSLNNPQDEFTLTEENIDRWINESQSWGIPEYTQCYGGLSFQNPSY